jgi:hypothetical protein
MMLGETSRSSRLDEIEKTGQLFSSRAVAGVADRVGQMIVPPAQRWKPGSDDQIRLGRVPNARIQFQRLSKNPIS